MHEESAGTNGPSRRPGPSHLLALSAILMAGLVLRALYVREASGDILYRFPVLDEDHYLAVARQLAGGDAPPGPFWRPPGLYLVLAAAERLLGSAVSLTRGLNVLLSSVSCLLTWLLARRFFSDSVAIVAAAMMALNGVLVATVLEIKDTNWILFLDLVLLLLLSHASGRHGARIALLAGILCGVSALFRPIVLAFLPLAALWLAFQVPGAPLRSRLAMMLLGVILPILPVAIHNNRDGGPFVLVCTNGGVNFFIGNNPDYLATVTARPGNQWESAILEPARKAGFEWDGPERERFYLETGAAYLLEHPAEGGFLWIRKLYLFFNGHEIPRDGDIYLDAEASALLRPLVWSRWPLAPLGLIIPLAAIGILGTAKRSRPSSLLVLFLLLQAGTVAAFFVSSRYRVPSIPVLSIFAAVGVFQLRDQYRTGKGFRRFGWAFLALVLAIGLNLSTAETRQSLRAERYYFKANALDRLGRHEEALRLYTAASAADRNDVRPLQGLANRLEEEGSYSRALPLRREIVRIGPYNARDRDRLLNVLLKEHRVKEAISALREDIEVSGHLPSRTSLNYFRLGSLQYEMSRFDDALHSFRMSFRLDAEKSARSITEWSRSADRPGAGQPGPGEGRFWLDLARLVSPGREREESFPIWRRAQNLLAGDPELTAEITEHLGENGDER